MKLKAEKTEFLTVKREAVAAHKEKLTVSLQCYDEPYSKLCLQHCNKCMQILFKQQDHLFYFFQCTGHLGNIGEK